MGGAQACLSAARAPGQRPVHDGLADGDPPPSSALCSLPIITIKYLHPKERGEQASILLLWHKNLGTFGNVCQRSQSGELSGKTNIF